MYPRSFLCEEAKIKQRTPLKEELVKSVRKQYGNPDSHPFFDFGMVIRDLKNPLIFISVQFEQKSSKLVKNRRHIESTIFNFLPWNHNQRLQ